MTNVVHDAKSFQQATGINDAILQKFQIWLNCLQDVNTHTNLVGRSTLKDFWFRHAYDSWQLYQIAPECRRWADLGSGAGFPGLAIAFALSEDRQMPSETILVESIAKKIAFLRHVSRETLTPVNIIHHRVELLDPIPNVDIVTARAMAPLDKLLGYVQPFVDKGAIALLPKGSRYQEELTQAQKNWTFDCDIISSQTAPDARILKIKELFRV